MEEQATSIMGLEPIEDVFPPYDSKNYSDIGWPKESQKPLERGALVVFIRQATYEKIKDHAKSDTRNEVGGALLGYYCRDSKRKRDFLVITDVFRAEPEINENFSSPALMKFTHTFFRKLDEHLDEINKDDPHLIRLGMYHSHPGYGVFMSSTDTATFRGVFSEPWHISLIFDPINNEVGIFYWEKNKEISRKSGLFTFQWSEPPVSDKLQSTEDKKNEDAATKVAHEPPTANGSPVE